MFINQRQSLALIRDIHRYNKIDKIERTPRLNVESKNCKISLVHLIEVYFSFRFESYTEISRPIFCQLFKRLNLLSHAQNHLNYLARFSQVLKQNTTVSAHIQQIIFKGVPSYLIY